MIAGLLVALLYLLDPADQSWGAEAIPILKYLPLELSVLALPFYLLGRRTRQRDVAWVILLAGLCAFALAGSTYTVLASHALLRDSFLGRGLNIFVVFPALLLFSRPREARLFARWLWPLVVLGATALTVQLAVWRWGVHFVDMPHVFHEEVFLLAGAAVLVFASLRRPASRGLLAALFWGACLLTFKNTGFLAALTASLILARLIWQRAPDAPGDRGTVFRRVAVVELGLLCAATVAIAFFVFRDLLPSGSPELRLLTYEQRWLAFRESPLIGTLFQGTPLLELPGRWSILVTPSHSDLLDILAFGGVVGFALFAAPLMVAGLAGWRALSTARPELRWLAAYSLTVAIVFLVEMAFNPVWDQPKLAFFFWLAIGCLLAFRRSSMPQGSPVGRRVELSSRSPGRAESSADPSPGTA
jgi:hypothetical protein